MISEFDVLFRVGIAIACGLFIGLERQMTGHAAGIKTNVLISLGSCIFVLFSFLTNDTDYTRIAAQVVSGVGFLCSSVIIKNGVSVNGLNTSATIWCTAGVGVISSLGEWKVSLAITFALILANLIFYPISEKIPVLRKFNDENDEKVYKLSISCLSDELMNTRKYIVETLNNTKFILTGIEIKTSDDISKTVIKVTVNYIGKMDNALLENVIRKLCEDNNILGVNWKLS